MENQKFFKEQRASLQFFTDAQLETLLKDYNFILRRIDNLWELHYFPERHPSSSHSFTGANLAYLLTKMMKAKKDESVSNVPLLE